MWHLFSQVRYRDPKRGRLSLQLAKDDAENFCSVMKSLKDYFLSYFIPRQ